jgi:hypothetical protein
MSRYLIRTVSVPGTASDVANLGSALDAYASKGAELVTVVPTGDATKMLVIFRLQHGVAADDFPEI